MTEISGAPKAALEGVTVATEGVKKVTTAKPPEMLNSPYALTVRNLISEINEAKSNKAGLQVIADHDADPQPQREQAETRNLRNEYDDTRKIGRTIVGIVDTRQGKNNIPIVTLTRDGTPLQEAVKTARDPKENQQITKDDVADVTRSTLQLTSQAAKESLLPAPKTNVLIEDAQTQADLSATIQAGGKLFEIYAEQNPQLAAEAVRPIFATDIARTQGKDITQVTDDEVITYAKNVHTNGARLLSIGAGKIDEYSDKPPGYTRPGVSFTLPGSREQQSTPQVRPLNETPPRLSPAEVEPEVLPGFGQAVTDGIAAGTVTTSGDINRLHSTFLDFDAKAKAIQAAKKAQREDTSAPPVSEASGEDEKPPLRATTPFTPTAPSAVPPAVTAPTPSETTQGAPPTPPRNPDGSDSPSPTIDLMPAAPTAESETERTKAVLEKMGEQLRSNPVLEQAFNENKEEIIDSIDDLADNSLTTEEIAEHMTRLNEVHPDMGALVNDGMQAARTFGENGGGVEPEEVLAEGDADISGAGSTTAGEGQSDRDEDTIPAPLEDASAEISGSTPEAPALTEAMIKNQKEYDALKEKVPDVRRLSERFKEVDEFFRTSPELRDRVSKDPNLIKPLRRQKSLDKVMEILQGLIALDENKRPAYSNAEIQARADLLKVYHPAAMILLIALGIWAGSLKVIAEGAAKG